MKKNKLGILAIAAVLSVTAGSALLLGNHLNAPQLSAGQQTVRLCARWSKVLKEFEVNTNNTKYQHIPVEFNGQKDHISLRLAPTNDFKMVNITRINAQFKRNSSLVKVGNKINITELNGNSVSYTAIVSDQGEIVANYTFQTPLEKLTSITFTYDEKMRPHDSFSAEIHGVDIFYNCVQ